MTAKHQRQLCTIAITLITSLCACISTQLATNIPSAAFPPMSPQPSLIPSVTQPILPSSTMIATSTSTQVSTPASSATPNVADFKDKWVVLENLAKGFSFEYPAIYDKPPWKYDCQPQAMSQWSTSFGKQISLDIYDADTQDLAAYVTQSIHYLQSTETNYKLISQSQGKQDKLDKIVLEYSTGEPSRYVIVTFFVVGHYTYEFHFTEGVSVCDIPSISLTTRDVYNHAVETFRFMN